MLNHLSLQKKLLIPVLIGILAFAFVVGAVLQYIVVQQTEQMAREKAASDLATLYEILDREYPGPWRIEDGTLYKGGQSMDRYNQLTDWLGELTGNTVTLFEGDTRIATNVTVDGQRAVGTQVSEDVAEQVLRRQQPFYGEADVAGQMYQTAYRPLIDTEGRAVGMFYTGASQELIDQALSHFTRGLLVVSAAALILLGLALVITIRHSVTAPVADMVSILQKVADLDLTAAQQKKAAAYQNRKDEIGIMAAAAASMQQRLTDVIASLKEMAANVASTSENLSASAQENSATIEEVASSVDSFSHTMDETEKNAAAMRSDAHAIRKLAAEGSGQMEHTRESMDTIVTTTAGVRQTLQELSEQAAEMASILDIISSIADQTNLLALNAAIEAARAGEHGRGFAVVADEVRNLAEQTQQSVGKISDMIQQLTAQAGQSMAAVEGAQQQTEDGSRLMAETQQSFTSITAKIQDSADSIDAIAGSIASMNETSGSIAAASEEQAASMEEIAGMTETMAQMGDQLRELVAKFNI